MNHELVTSTSMPASEPIRIVPGARAGPTGRLVGPRGRRLRHHPSLSGRSSSARRCRCRAPRVRPMPAHVARRDRLHARGRRRRARGALAEPGRRLHDLPVDVSLPHASTSCPSSRRSMRCAARWCTRCSRTSSTCRPPSARPTGPPTCWSRRGTRCSPRTPELAEMFGGEGPDVGVLADELPRGAHALLHPRGPAPPRAGRARGVRRSAARLQAAAARLRGPRRHRARRPDQGGGLQDRPQPRRGLRGQGAVPDEVLRARHLAHPRRRAGDAAAGLSRQRRDAPLRARRGRPARHRAQGRRDLAGDQGVRGGAGLAAEQVGALLVVLLQGALPGVRRHAAAGARAVPAAP